MVDKPTYEEFESIVNGLKAELVKSRQVEEKSKKMEAQLQMAQKMEAICTLAGGTGLGLASVYGIIKTHGGYIDVESRKKHGTAFKVYLPASKRKVRKVTKTSDKLIKGTGTVFLVDDEEVIQEVCRELLEAIGYRVFSAIDGKEALNLYRKNQDKIDLVLLDMTMPNMSGSEVYNRMKEMNPDIKVLFSSGYSIDGEATDILKRGCNGFIQKPFNINALSQKIREMLEKK